MKEAILAAPQQIKDDERKILREAAVNMVTLSKKLEKIRPVQVSQPAIPSQKR
jgi:hypothetical protein